MKSQRWNCPLTIRQKTPKHVKLFDKLEVKADNHKDLNKLKEQINKNSLKMKLKSQSFKRITACNSTCCEITTYAAAPHERRCPLDNNLSKT